MADGLEVRGKSLRVYFMFNGEKCREPFGQATPENMQRAKRLVQIINLEIEGGTFDYARHFPNSKRVVDNSFGFYAHKWLEISEKQLSASSFRAYKSKMNKTILPRWAAHTITNIDYLAINSWMATDLAEYSQKTIKTVVSLMSQVFDLYSTTQKQHFNPTTGIKVRLPDLEDPDPFTKDEIQRLITTDTDDVQMRDMIAFMLYDGCRPSEALGLAWEDVLDLNKGEIQYRRARVVGKYKVPKTKRSTRKHILLKPAREVLQRQFLRTSTMPAVEIEVVDRDNKTVRKQKIRPVFRKEGGTVVTVDKALRETFFKDHCEKAKVRYRPPSQCRHTFISQMLTLGDVPLQWIAAHVGHSSIEMIQKHYGKWITQDGQDMQALIENRLSL